MERIPVSSSDIASIGYEDDVLEIEFHSGGSVYWSGPHKVRTLFA